MHLSLPHHLAGVKRWLGGERSDSYVWNVKDWHPYWYDNCHTNVLGKPVRLPSEDSLARFLQAMKSTETIQSQYCGPEF